MEIPCFPALAAVGDAEKSRVASISQTLTLGTIYFLAGYIRPSDIDMTKKVHSFLTYFQTKIIPMNTASPSRTEHRTITAEVCNEGLLR